MQNKARFFAMVIALAAWFALSGQLVLILQNREASVMATIIRFFGFFTILTNLLVACWFSVLVWQKPVKWLSFFQSLSTQTACTVYILVVGIVYNLVLRFTWQPRGWQKIVDETLHSLVPMLVLIYWLFFVPKSTIKWSISFRWMIYPLGYTSYTLVHGALSNYYPYPFIDVTKIGYPKVIVNGVFTLLFFYLLSLLLIYLSNLAVPKTKNANP